jgi:hypothetical protein
VPLRARANVARAPGGPRDSALRVLRPVCEELAVTAQRFDAVRTQARPGVSGRLSMPAARTPRWSAGRRGAHARAPHNEWCACRRSVPSPAARETEDASGANARRENEALFDNRIG